MDPIITLGLICLPIAGAGIIVSTVFLVLDLRRTRRRLEPLEAATTTGPIRVQFSRK